MHLKFRKSQIAASHDIIMAAISYVVSLYLRLGENFNEVLDFLIPSTILFTTICAAVFSLLGLYKGIWRYASLQDLLAVIKAVTLAILVFTPAMFLVTRLDDFPRSVLIINWMVLIALLGGPRFFYRAIKDKTLFFNFAEDKDKRISVLLAGISDNAIHFLRDSNKRDSAEYKIVGIIDNNPENIGREINGVKVYGGLDMAEKVINKLRKKSKYPRRIILGREQNDGSQVSNLLNIAEKQGLTLAKLPQITDFTDNVDKIKVKPIAIEDLLGRPQRAPNLGRRKELISGKKVLVTGAGGTIGSELVRQIANFNPIEIIILDISEFNLYKIDSELAEKFPNLNWKSLIGDVRDFKLLDKIFEYEKPDLVFHAAALKHVPIVEQNILEAAYTNIIGSKNIADLCLKHKAKKMIMVSTDKAVNPTSLMGVTKRIAECYIQAISSEKNTNTDFATVRFGNVLGSSGSVIPLFQKQLENNGPLTVTHPDMVRYFMTVPEAVELVLQAATLDKTQNDSSIYVLDMGKPIKIDDLAKQMIRLAGFTPNIDIKIEYVGIRAGEKLYEELFYENEKILPTLYEGIKLAKAKKLDIVSFEKQIKTIKECCNNIDEAGLITTLSKAVPEYKTNKEEATAC